MSSGRINLLSLGLTAAMEPCVPPKLSSSSSAGVPSSFSSGIVPAVPPKAPSAGSAGSGTGIAASSAESDEFELSSDELELEELDELEESSLPSVPEVLVSEDSDELADAVELAMTDMVAMAVAPGVVSSTLDALEATALVATALEATALVATALVARALVAAAEVTDVKVPLPAPTLLLLADTITKSTQLS
jgi:hypothetical protein